MQGSRTHIAAAMTGLILAGCIVQQAPRQPPAKAAAAAPATRNAPFPALPPRPAPAPATAPAGRTHTIKPGDNLWNLSKQFYGDGTKYQRILDANPSLNPDNMKPGTKIVVP